MAKKLDVIIFGATGFTGKYTVFEAISVLKDLSWGIAGRNQGKLQTVLRDMGAKANKDISNTPIIEADVSNPSSLLKMAKRCRIVVNTCGPYRFYGEEVVKACIQAGTHHVDVSGETQYMESMQLKYNEQAKERGVYVVSACGFDSIPVDMGVVFAEKNFDGVVNSIETFLKSGQKGGNVKGPRLNYGTWESAVHGMANINEVRGIRQKLYPASLPKFQPIVQQRPLFSRPPEVDSVCLPFPGPDSSVVMRSQRFLYEHEKKRPLHIHTYITFSSWFAAAVVTFFSTIFGVLTRFKFGQQLLLNYPGVFSGGFASRDGPSEATMARSFFNITIKATGWANSERLSEVTDQYVNPPTKTLLVKVSGSNPGYGATCVALLCTAKTILKESDKMPNNGGVLPPGAAFAKTSLISELEKYEQGIKFDIIPNY